MPAKDANAVRNARLADFPHVFDLPTRWMDNDIYGHVNNVSYYSYFDTAVNRYLIDAGVLDIHKDPVVGFVVETGCSYFRPVAFPDALRLGLRVAHLGTSSVRYELGLFRAGEEDSPAAVAHFVHVYVERASGKSASIPTAARAALQQIRFVEKASG